MDSRSFPRLKTLIGVRFLVNGDQAADGVSINLSAGGVAIATDFDAQVGDEIIAHFAGGARCSGKVLRKFSGGFAMTLDISDPRRERLLNALEPLFSQDGIASVLQLDRRIAERVDARDVEARCVTERGPVSCRIIDISLTGAAIKTNGYIRMDSNVLLGQTKGKVVRKHDDIYGIEFEAHIAPEGGARASEKTTESAAPGKMRATG